MDIEDTDKVNEIDNPIDDGKNISISKKALRNYFFGILALLIILFILFNNGSINGEKDEIKVVYNSLSPKAKALYYVQSDELTKEVPERIVELDELKIGCFGSNKIMQMSESDSNLGGQCCGALRDFDSYEIQLQSLREFIHDNGNLAFIPKDPYDISVKHAKELTVLDTEIILSVRQQTIFDKAIELSHHGGPCCCKCWKWYLMSGLAKKLIVDHNWNENQISELWDKSSSCGHKEDTNMNEHYEIEDDH